MQPGPGAALVQPDVERWPAVDVIGDDLAIDDGIVRKRFPRTRDRSETLSEVFAVARKQVNPAAGLETIEPVPSRVKCVLYGLTGIPISAGSIFLKT